MASKTFMADPTAALFSRMAISPAPVKQKERNASPEKIIKKEAPPNTDIISTGSFYDFYQKEERIQKGSFGVVYEASRVVSVGHHDNGDANGQKFAVKVIDRTRLKKQEDTAVFREVRILKELVDVPNVITLVDFYVDSQHLYVVQHLAAGGDVFDRLVQRKTYTEQFARELAKTLLQTLKVVHERNIIHRDLKPGNILLASGSDDCAIMLADFGFAKHTDTDGYCRTRCGTPMYVAPEIILDVPYTSKVDCWSCGCIIYMLLGGYPPFPGDNMRNLFQRIRAGNYTFHEKSWGNVSIQAKQMIVNLLTVNPKHRWTAEQALESSWMTAISPARLKENDLRDSLTHIRARRRLRAAMDAVRWATTANFWKPEKVTFHQQVEALDKSLLSDNPEWSQSSGSAGSTTSTATNGVMEGMSPQPSSSTRIKTKSFEDCYTLRQKVRKGDYATVWECQHNDTQEVFAVKIIPRSNLSTIDDEQVLNEVAILQSVSIDAPKSIVGLKDFFEEESAFYVVMELLIGGDVFDRVAMRSHYNERDARALAKQLLEAVDILHKKGVAHRDIKPHNLLLQSSNNDSNIKLCDFGFARRVHTPQSLTHRVGTPPYVAPEILKNIPHDERVDLWSVGITIFVLLVGYPPFVHEDREMVCQQIKAGAWRFNKRDWARISPDAKQLIEGLLQVDPVERLSASEALQSKWIQHLSDEALANRELRGSLTKLKQKRNDLREAASRTLTWFANTKKLHSIFGSKPISTPTQAHESIVQDSIGNFVEVTATDDIRR